MAVKTVSSDAAKNVRNYLSLTCNLHHTITFHVHSDISWLKYIIRLKVFLTFYTSHTRNCVSNIPSYNLLHFLDSACWHVCRNPLMMKKLPFALHERMIAATGNKQLDRESESQGRPVHWTFRKCGFTRCEGQGRHAKTNELDPAGSETQTIITVTFAFLMYVFNTLHSSADWPCNEGITAKQKTHQQKQKAQHSSEVSNQLYFNNVTYGRHCWNVYDAV